MSSKNALRLLVLLGLLGFVGAIGIHWLFSPGQEAQVVTVSLMCPPVPRHKTGFAVTSYYEGTGRMTFQATEDMATSTEEFGWLSHDFDGYTLYVDSRYDFQEVLDYLSSWNECYHGEDLYIGGIAVSRHDWEVPPPAATPAPTPGTTVISTGIARYMMPMDDRYYAVPACSYWADGLQWLVPCSIPCLPCPQAKLVGIRNSSEALRVIFFDAPLDIASQFTELGRLFHTTSGWFELYVDVRYDFPEVLAYLQSLRSVPQGHATPMPAPTATRELDVESWIEWLTSQWHFTPDLDDWLLIDWPDSIIITDALSQTMVIQGPATVRFGEGGSR